MSRHHRGVKAGPALVAEHEDERREEYRPPPELRRLIRPDGSMHDFAEIFRGVLEIGRRIGATSPDYFWLQDAMHAVVFDAEANQAKPVNMPAELIYRASNRLAGKVRSFRGDVMLCPRTDLLL